MQTQVVNDDLDPYFERAYFVVPITPDLPPLSKCVLGPYTAV